MWKEARPNLDVSLEVGYNLATHKASFSIGLSNIFGRIGRRPFGFSFSIWRTSGIGRQDGKLGLPRTEAVSADGREADVSNERDVQAQKVAKRVADLKQQIESWVSSHKPIQEIDANRIQKEIDAKIEEILSYFQRISKTAQDDFTASLDEYREFRESHKLRRPAEVPSTIVEPLALLAIALVCESALNSMIFASVNDRGILGGWALSACISLVNIFLGLCLGLLVFRYLPVWNDWRRNTLIGCATALVAGIVFFNSYTAHFRDLAERAIRADQEGTQALARDRIPTFRDAWSYFWSNPFAFGDVVSIFLFLLGMSIAGYASYKGFRAFTDPYPGYGRCGNRFYRSYEDILRHENDILELCFRSLDLALTKITVSWSMHAHFKQELQNVQALVKLLRKAATEAEERVNSNAWKLINAYRAANRRMRKKLSDRHARKPEKYPDDPGRPPEYFDTDPRQVWNSVMPDIDDTAENVHQALDLIDRNLARLDVVREYVAGLRKSMGDRVRGLLPPEHEELRREAGLLSEPIKRITDARYERRA